MRMVSKRDLNQRTAEVLGGITDDTPTIVTERGRPRWQIETFHGPVSTMERLEREGSYTPPVSSPTPWASTPERRGRGAVDVDALLDETRGDH